MSTSTPPSSESAPDEASPETSAAPGPGPIGPDDGFQPTHADSPVYHRDGAVVYSVVYYVQIVTRRRRALFRRRSVRERAAELLREAAGAMGVGIDGIDVRPATITFQFQASPKTAPHKVVRNLRRAIVAPLREEFEHIRGASAVFVRDYLLSTYPVPEMDSEVFEQHVPKRWAGWTPKSSGDG